MQALRPGAPAPRIAGTAASGPIGGPETDDLYRIVAITQRDGSGFHHITWIPTDLDEEPEELFDPAYMQAL